MAEGHSLPPVREGAAVIVSRKQSSFILVAVVIIIAFAAAVFIAHLPGCYRLEQHGPNPPGVITYYWMERHPTTEHGVCATMYDGGAIWVVEKPWGVDPKTKMSLGTNIKQFDSRAEAENWAEASCPSWSKNWDTLYLDTDGNEIPEPGR